MKKKKKQSLVCNDGVSKSKLFDLVLLVFRKFPAKKLNYKELSRRLNVSLSVGRAGLIDIMKEMCDFGFLVEGPIGSFRLAEKSPSFISVVKNTNGRGVYVEVSPSKEIFISKEHSSFSLAGDHVEITLFTRKKNRSSGRVLRVIRRKKNSFVGVVGSFSSNYFLVSNNKNIYFDIFIPPKKMKNEYLKKLVLVEVEDWGSGKKNPIGRVSRVIGNINDHGAEMNSILYSHGFESDFPKDVSFAANSVTKTISKAEIKDRLDLRNVCTLTIDPEDAKDFDDALSIRKLKSGGWEVGVHIADVSHYVREGDVIDSEAAKRATSVYLVDRVVPMLPEVLSNNLCSLMPSVDRLAYSVLFEFDSRLCLSKYSIKKTVIHSDLRLSYQQAERKIKTKSGNLHAELLVLNNISKVLRKKRKENGSINFESTEAKFILDKKNNPIGVYFKESLDANKLIEEFMLLANKTVAKHFGANKKVANAFVYRVHDRPDKNKINDLFGLARTLGYKINFDFNANLSHSLNQLIHDVRGKSEQKMIEVLIARSMAKAVYDCNNIGHYGLAFDYYSHFTSPIRRYPDLLVHRLLSRYIDGKKEEDEKSLAKICSHCSEMERSASLAERASTKHMQIIFLKTQIGNTFEGVVSGVTEWGLYVEIIENGCEGLISVGSIKNDHYVFNKKLFSLVGQKSKQTYQLGQKVVVRVNAVDLDKKQADFGLIIL